MDSRLASPATWHEAVEQGALNVEGFTTWGRDPSGIMVVLYGDLMEIYAKYMLGTSSWGCDDDIICGYVYIYIYTLYIYVCMCVYVHNIYIYIIYICIMHIGIMMRM